MMADIAEAQHLLPWVSGAPAVNLADAHIWHSMNMN
jgi:hypothetical protein